MLLAGQMTPPLRATSFKAINLAFLDVVNRIVRTLLDLAHQPEAMTRPDGMQIRITHHKRSLRSWVIHAKAGAS